MQSIDIGEVLSDEFDVGQLVICQLHVHDVLHALFGAFHDLDAAVVDVLIDQGEDLLLLLVDVLHLLRDYELFLRSVFVYIDQVHPILLRYLKDEVLPQEPLLCVVLDQIVYLGHLFLVSLLVDGQSVDGHDALDLQLLESLHLDALGLQLDAQSEGRQLALRLGLSIDDGSAGVTYALGLIFKQHFFESIHIFILESTETADHVPAFLIETLLMLPEIIGMGVCTVAVTADEGPVQRNVVMLEAESLAAHGLCSHCSGLILDEIEVLDCPGVQAGPYGAEFRERSEECAAKLIDIVAEHVRTLDEFGGD